MKRARSGAARQACPMSESTAAGPHLEEAPDSPWFSRVTMASTEAHGGPRLMDPVLGRGDRRIEGPLHRTDDGRGRLDEAAALRDLPVLLKHRVHMGLWNACDTRRGRTRRPQSLSSSRFGQPRPDRR